MSLLRPLASIRLQQSFRSLSMRGGGGRGGKELPLRCCNFSSPWLPLDCLVLLDPACLLRFVGASADRRCIRRRLCQHLAACLPALASMGPHACRRAVPASAPSPPTHGMPVCSFCRRVNVSPASVPPRAVRPFGPRQPSAAGSGKPSMRAPLGRLARGGVGLPGRLRPFGAAGRAQRTMILAAGGLLRGRRWSRRRVQNWCGTPPAKHA